MSVLQMEKEKAESLIASIVSTAIRIQSILMIDARTPRMLVLPLASLVRQRPYEEGEIVIHEAEKLVRIVIAATRLYIHTSPTLPARWFSWV